MLSSIRIAHSFICLALSGLFFLMPAVGALAQTDWKKDWERTLQEAKKEGKLVAGIPARAELRKELEAIFKPKFGIDMELLPARGPQNASRIAAEAKAGVKYFDVFIGGSGTFESLAEDGNVEPLMPNLILPEVREPKLWWGGHIWEDNLKTNRFLYSFIADAGTGGYWHNTDLVKSDEIRRWTIFCSPSGKARSGFSIRGLPAPANRSGLFSGTFKGENT